MSFTLIIIIITCLVSYSAFTNHELYNRFILWPKRMNEPKEYYRLISSGFIHANWMHLFFNMFTLWGFGNVCENFFASEAGNRYLYLALYLGALIVSSLPSFLNNRNNGSYRSLGASGAVSAVLFSGIYTQPWSGIRIFPIPIDIPAIAFGGVYLIYCVYMAKKGGDNINHSAHFWGAIFGFVFTFLFDPFHGQTFLQQIMPN